MAKIKVELEGLAPEKHNPHYDKLIKNAQTTEYKWSTAQKKKVKEIFAKYPDTKLGRRSALLPLLHLAQDEFDGWLPTSLMKLVADTLDMEVIKVQEVASFYTMFNLKPVGKYHLQICTNCACVVNGVGEVLDALKQEVGEVSDNISEDGLFTVTEVECLGACVESPVVQVNKEYKTKLSADSVRELVKNLRAEG